MGCRPGARSMPEGPSVIAKGYCCLRAYARQPARDPTKQKAGGREKGNAGVVVGVSIGVVVVGQAAAHDHDADEAFPARHAFAALFGPIMDHEDPS